MFRRGYGNTEIHSFAFRKYFSKLHGDYKYNIVLGRRVFFPCSSLSLFKNKKFMSWMHARGYSSVVEHFTADREVTGLIPVAPYMLVIIIFSAFA